MGSLTFIFYQNKTTTTNMSLNAAACHCQPVVRAQNNATKFIRQEPIDTPPNTYIFHENTIRTLPAHCDSVPCLFRDVHREKSAKITAAGRHMVGLTFSSHEIWEDLCFSPDAIPGLTLLVPRKQYGSTQEALSSYMVSFIAHSGSFATVTDEQMPRAVNVLGQDVLHWIPRSVFTITSSVSAARRLTYLRLPRILCNYSSRLYQNRD